MSSILVTGGAGFIGVNLCDRLAELGHTVVSLDNKLCPSPLAQHPEVASVNLDVKELRNLGDFDYIYHLASLASPVWYKKHPIFTIDTNINGTIAVCNAAVKCGAHVIFTSTSEVYGQPKEHPQNEYYNGNVSTTSLRACYDESKRCAETIISEYYRKGMDATIVRIFNTYGYGMRPDDGRVVSEFICSALKGEALTVFGSGAQTRSFCYIQDMVDWLVLMMGAGTIGPFNIGNDTECSINDLISVLQTIFGKQLSVKFTGNSDLADPSRRCPDLARSKAYLQHYPEFIDLEEGLRRTIRYFKKMVR